MASERPRIRVLVVDDEPVARRVLLGLLAQESDMEVVGSCGNAADAIRALHEEEVDVIFLDIQMPERNGFDVLRAVDDDALPMVVFVTAHDEHAIRAFEVGALDYVLKPFDDDRFAAAAARVRKRMSSGARAEITEAVRSVLRSLADPVQRPISSESATLDPGSTRIAIRTGKKIRFVDPEDINWIEAENYYVKLHTNDRVHLLRESLTRLETRLDPLKFVRVHRSAIVCIQRVAEIQVRDSSHCEAVLRDGTAIRVSRSRRRQLLRALGIEAGSDG